AVIVPLLGSMRLVQAPSSVRLPPPVAVSEPSLLQWAASRLMVAPDVDARIEPCLTKETLATLGSLPRKPFLPWMVMPAAMVKGRSEERRVGKEGRLRGGQAKEKEKPRVWVPAKTT